VRLTLKADDLAFLGLDMKPVLEAGVVNLLVGPTAERVSLQQISIEVRAG
jgi:hypothetical protein